MWKLWDPAAYGIGCHNIFNFRSLDLVVFRDPRPFRDSRNACGRTNAGQGSWQGRGRAHKKVELSWKTVNESQEVLEETT